MTFSLFGTKVRIPMPLVGTMILMSLVLKRDIVSPTSALLVHELGHMIAARAMRVRICSVAVCPLGASMRLELCDSVSAAVVALSGPAASLVAATIGICAMDIAPQFGVLKEFSTYSLVICGFNLLPAMPLDGGRILMGILQGVFSQKTSKIITFVTGICVVAVLFGVSFAFYPQIHWSMLAITLFTLYGCIIEFKSGVLTPVNRVLKSEISLANSGSLRLKAVGFGKNVRAGDAMAQLRGASLIVVVDDKACLLGTMSEGDLLNGMVEQGKDTKLIEILRAKRSNNKFFKE